MTYTKPEIAVLGDASRVIRGSQRQDNSEPHPNEALQQVISDCELDD